LAISTFIFWPLPLLHGRKPYILAGTALIIPLQFPQAIIVMGFRSPNAALYRSGLLLSRLLIGFFLGFVNINFFTTLLDLFGASLQSHFPHHEIVVNNDPRRDGGGLGVWLGFWTWCYIGSIAVGFAAGAGIINNLNPEWGFYIAVILLLVNLMINIITPETRRSPSRRTTKRFLDSNERIRKLVGRGEVKLHISSQPPK
jgi:MFS family permease